jgi:uncharacterized protein (TIGR02246 family)
MGQEIYKPGNDEETAVHRLYEQLLTYWNKRDAHRFAGLFAEAASVIGFDGSQMNGRPEIESALKGVFDNHPTASYVFKIREIKNLSADVMLLRSVVGMVPPGKSDINPATNAIQSLVAKKHGNEWVIMLFQNTPAQFHGRPELAEELTKELQELAASF